VLFASERSGEAAWAAVGMALPGLCALRPPRRFATALSAAALVLFAADQIRYAKPLVEVRSVEDAYGRNPVVQRVHAPLGRQRTVALNHTRKGRFSSLPITYAAQAEIEILHGFSPLLPRGCYQMLWSGVAQEPLNWRFATDMGTFPIVERRFLDLLNVRWVVTNRALELRGLTLRERLDDIEVYHYTRSTTGLTLLEETYVYENQHVMPRAAIVRAAERVASMQEAIERIPAIDPRKTVLLDGQGPLAAYAGSFEPVQVTHRYDELQMTLDAGDGGYLLLSEMWFPGWRAWDGRREIEILRANGAFQAVHLSPGRHHLRFAYQPAAYELGTKLSAMGFGTGALLLLYGGARRRNSPAGAARIYSDNGQALEPRSR
jgi:hypothetical protein